MAVYRIYVRNSALERVGELDTYTKAVVQPAFNAPGAWSLALPAMSAITPLLLAPGAGVIFVREDGTTILSGPVANQDRQWDGDNDNLIVGGPDDTIVLADRLALPYPPAPTWTIADYDVRTDVAETIMHDFVNDNAGPGAMFERRVTGLTLATNGGLGSTITGRARFQSLLELLQYLALAGGGLGFRVVQVSTGIQFQVYNPTDKSASIKLSSALGNLRRFRYVIERSTGNYIYVGGNGEGTTRTIVIGGNGPSQSLWGRIEAFVDRRGTTNITELEQARDKELSDRSTRTGLEIEPVDTESMVYGVDYGLGDKVTVIIDGVAFVDIVRQATIVQDQSGQSVAPTIGTPDLTVTKDGFSLMVLAIQSLRSRISNLERR